MDTPLNGIRFKWEFPYFKLFKTPDRSKKILQSSEFTFNGATFCLKLKKRTPQTPDNWLYLAVKDFGPNSELKLRRHLWLHDDTSRMVSITKRNDEEWTVVKEDYDWKEGALKIRESEFEETDAHEEEPNKLTIFCDLYCDEECMESEINIWRKKIAEYSAKGIFGHCTLRINGNDFKVAKQLLMLNSEVFERIIMDNSNETIIEIEEVSVEAVREMIKYFNTGKIGVSNEHAEGLFIAAEKYAIKGLQEKCVKKLLSTLNVANCLQRLVLAFNHSSVEFRNVVSTYVKSKNRGAFKDIAKSDEWKKFLINNPQISSDIVTRMFIGNN